MARYRFSAFTTSSQPSYVVLWDLQWQLLEVVRLDPGADLSAAMTAAIERLKDDGWQAEATPEYGSVFVHRDGDRRLLMLTPRDPQDTGAQSFSPFRDHPPAG